MVLTLDRYLQLYKRELDQVWKLIQKQMWLFIRVDRIFIGHDFRQKIGVV